MDKKLKILYVAPRFRPFKGGGEENLYAFASRMAKNGHEVTVVTPKLKFRNEELPNTEIMDGMKIVRQWALNEQLYAGFYPGLLPFLLQNDFDVIHTTGIGFLWREVCLIITKLIKPKTKMVTTPHGPFMATVGEEDSELRKFAKKYYTMGLKTFVPWLYDLVISINSRQEEWMTKEYGIDPKKIILIPNGIPEDYLEKELVEHDKDERVVITYLNRHEWYKGIQDVVKAIAKLKEFKPEEIEQKRTKNKIAGSEYALPMFYIMGRAGNYTAKITELIEELGVQNETKFIFSPTDEERDRIFYEESQINILPSKWEGTGITLIEAMAKGNAIITTNQNEAEDILIKPGISGYSYDFGNVDALAEILLVFLTSYENRQNIRKHNITFAKEFTWESVFPKYEKEVESLMLKV